MEMANYKYNDDVIENLKKLKDWLTDNIINYLYKLMIIELKTFNIPR